MDSKKARGDWMGMARAEFRVEGERADPWADDGPDPLREFNNAVEGLARGHWTRVDGEDQWSPEPPEAWSPPRSVAGPTRADWLFHCMARMWMLWREEVGRMSVAEAVARVPEEQWVRMFEEGLGIGPSRVAIPVEPRPAAARPARSAEPGAARTPPAGVQFRFGKPLPLERQMRSVWDDDAEEG